MEEPKASPELAGLLDRNKEKLATSWALKLHALQGSRYLQLSIDELQSWTAAGLGAVVRTLSTGSTGPLKEHVSRVVAERRRLGFDIREVISGLLRLEDAALPFISSSDPERTHSMRADLDACVRILVSEFGGRYASAMREEVEHQRDYTSRLLRSLEAVGGTLDLHTVGASVAHRLRQALHAPYCGIWFEPHQGGPLDNIATSADSSLEGLSLQLHRHLVAPLGSALRRELSKRKSLWYRNDDPCPLLFGATARTLGVRGLVAVPIVAKERLAAVAFVAIQDAPSPEEDGRQQLVEGIANAVAPAVEHARRYAEARRHLEETKALHQISSALLEKTELASMLEIVCRESRRLTNASSSAILLDGPEEGLHTAAQVGEKMDWPDPRWPEPLRSVPPKIPVEPVLFNDTSSPGTPPGSTRLRSLVAVPMRLRGRPIGLLRVANKENGFDERDLRILCKVADQAAMAVGHAQLHDQQERLAVVEERQRVARDLHDSVTQSLTALSMFAAASERLLERRALDELAGTLRDVRDVARKALWEMRLLIFELHPMELRSRSLSEALAERLTAVESRAGLKAEFYAKGVGGLPRRIEEAMYRIAQEALTNAVQHAHASRVSLRLSLSGRILCMEFEDNGVGFDPAAGRRSAGIGLRSMRERTDQINGAFRLESQPGRGTRIEVRVDLSEADSREPDADGISRSGAPAPSSRGTSTVPLPLEDETGG